MENMDNPAMDKNLPHLYCDASINTALVSKQETHIDKSNNIDYNSDSEINILNPKGDSQSWSVNKNLEVTFGIDKQLSPALNNHELNTVDISGILLTSQTSNKCSSESNNALLPSYSPKSSGPIESDSNDAILDRVLNINDKHSDNNKVKIKKHKKIKKITNLVESSSDSENENSRLDIDKNESEENPNLDNSKGLNRLLLDSDNSDNEDPTNKKPLNQKPIKSRLKTLIDSDSSEEELSECDNEDPKNRETLDEKDDTENTELKKKTIKSRLRTLINSDSSDEESPEASKSNNIKLDTDGSDQEKGGNISNTETSSKTFTNMPVEAPVYVTNDKGDLIIENPKQNAFQSRISALCDPDSDDDYPIENTDYQNINIEETKYKTSEWLQKGKPSGKKGKKTKTDVKAERTFKMTPRDAAKQREEIAAESQRMVREKDVSLPYHKPKSHTLQEFLTRRSKLASVVPIKNRGNTSIATAVRMSKEQLEAFQKRIEEREKELKEFYKSDSEGSDVDDPNDTEYIPPGLEADNQEKTTQDLLNELDKEDIEEKSNQPNILNLLTENSTNIDKQKIDSDLSKKLEDDLNLESMDTCTENSIEQIDENIKEIEESSLGVKPTETDTISTDVINDAENAINSKETEEFSLRLEETEVDNPISNEKNDVLNKKDQTDLGEHHENCNTEKISGIPQQNTMSYDFSLDDIEDLSKSNNEISIDEPDDAGKIEESCNKKDEIKKEFEYGELDKEIENFGNENANLNKPKSKIVIQSDFAIVPRPVDDDLDEELDMAPKKSKLQLLKEKLAKTTPKLCGEPDQLIDLDAGKEKSEAMTRFMENFVRHAAIKKHSAKHKVSLSILRVESGGDIHQETVAINVDDDDETAVSKIEEKPGAKLQRLRKELRSQMEKEKLERWEKKASEGIKPTTNESSDKDGYEDNLPDEYDDEEEEILTDEDEEFEEDDVEMVDKPIKKSAFLDEEAEESATEDVEDVENPSENEDAVEPDDSKPTTEDETSNMSTASNMTAQSSNVDDSDSKPASEDELPDLTVAGKNRPLKRIVKAFDDSDSEGDNEDNDSSVLENTLVEENQGNTCSDKNYQELIQKSQDEDEEILAYQPRQAHQTPIRQLTQPKTMEFNTPTSFITGLENLKSATKSVKDSPVPIVSPFQMSQDSPLKTGFVSQKKLFSESEADSQDLNPVQETQPELTQLNQETGENPVKDTQPTDSLNLAETMPKEDAPCTQDILNICSGAFTGVTQFDLTEKSAVEKSLVLDTQNQTQEIKTLGEDQDLIISQLLDEEELENFKKKFESPVNKPATQSLTQFTQKREEVKEISGGGVLDSDEEDGEGSETQIKVKKKIRNRKIAFSDDESSSDEDELDQNEEEIDLADNEDIEDEENVELDNIGYDSDENEINLEEDGQPSKKEKLKIKDFMEDEAELSESEWGSEDEDEKDLDKLEFEIGDTEKFDEDQMKEDLEKIHMRRLLDDDTREVKLLQELLLEDGEMHGSGRQRQFRWKNIDELGDDDDSTKRDEDDIYLDEEESEEQWRKRRHEREMFLKEKESQSQDGEDSTQDVLLGKSKLLSIGQKILQRSLNSQSSNSPTTETPTEKIESPLIHKFTLLNKRGSFLSRGEQALQRVAEFTTKTTININGSKTTKNFVFQSVSATTELAVLQNKKRKAKDGTPDVLKKLRLSNTFSPAAAGVKKQKPERAKKLF